MERRHLPRRSRVAAADFTRLASTFPRLWKGALVCALSRGTYLVTTRSSRIHLGLDDVLVFRKGYCHGEWYVKFSPSFRKGIDFSRQVDRRKTLEFDKVADCSKADTPISKRIPLMSSSALTQVS